MRISARARLLANYYYLEHGNNDKDSFSVINRNLAFPFDYWDFYAFPELFVENFCFSKVIYIGEFLSQ